MLNPTKQMLRLTPRAGPRSAHLCNPRALSATLNTVTAEACSSTRAGPGESELLSLQVCETISPQLWGANLLRATCLTVTYFFFYFMPTAPWSS